MTVIILSLALLSFLQTAFSFGELALLVILLRTFLVGDKLNFWLAFGIGLLLSLLSNLPLGSLSLLYLALVMIVQIIRNTSLASNWLFICPTAFGLTALSLIIQSFIFQFTPDYKIFIGVVILTIPFYFILRFWEERFIPKKELRLRIGK